MRQSKVFFKRTMYLPTFHKMFSRASFRKTENINYYHFEWAFFFSIQLYYDTTSSKQSKKRIAWNTCVGLFSFCPFTFYSCYNKPLSRNIKYMLNHIWYIFTPITSSHLLYPPLLHGSLGNSRKIRTSLFLQSGIAFLYNHIIWIESCCTWLGL